MYTVMVDDNYHFMDEHERYALGTFATREAAVAAAQAVVETFLQSARRPGLTAEALYAQYVAFGEDPFIVGPAGEAVTFSAWTYARERCEALAHDPPPA